MTITKEDLQTTVEEAVKRAFRDVGIHADEPEHVDEVRADFLFIRRMRKSSEGLAARVGAAFITVMVGGMVWLLGGGLKAWLGLSK